MELHPVHAFHKKDLDTSKSENPKLLIMNIEVEPNGPDDYM